MKKNGQALVEFIIILPIFIILILSIMDFGIIFMKKNSLENTLDEVVEIWKKEKKIESIDEYLNKTDEIIEFSVSELDKNNELILESSYEVMTPGLNLVLGNPYKIKVSRVISNE